MSELTPDQAKILEMVTDTSSHSNGREPGWIEPDCITTGWLQERMNYGYRKASATIRGMMRQGVLIPARVRMVNLHGIEMTVNGYRLVKGNDDVD